MKQKIASELTGIFAAGLGGAGLSGLDLDMVNMAKGHFRAAAQSALESESEFLEAAAQIEPLLRKHPGWKWGDAAKALAAKKAKAP